ncbi:hypothetical protein AAFC00_005439 [Neodothiora populina]|uniref:NmrA-like domain-containing protein n=1 Tax=Neodothiora populina TaxID=2781224 RepID=A0ABR3PKV8_9PEZI
MSKNILVTGATGKQGGAVIDSLLDLPNASDYTILAVTRDARSGSAQKLAGKAASIKLVEGNLDDVPTLFKSASEVAKQPIWGVYSVQISMGKGVTFEGEVKQGCDLVDESVKHGVKHFVYSSVERGGDEKSWDTPTPVPHFQTKQLIEIHLRDHAAQMGWTILRPVAFMDNLQPAFPTKVFMTAVHNTLGDSKPMQWVATADIGYFAAQAFAKPEEWNHEAVGLAGAELTVPQLDKAFENATGSPLGTTFSFLGSALMWGVSELGHMIGWFGSDGYRADIPGLKKIHPGLIDMETWIKEKSAFKSK